MLQTNWHTHTSRCGHAIGEDEEYVLKAIKAGFKTLGFSDHSAFTFEEPGTRMPYSELNDYITSINYLKEKYKNEINIYLGVETEYYPTELEMLEFYRKEFDYMILGQHGINPLDRDASYFMKEKEDLYLYLERVEEACIKGLCDYIAHPDVCMYNYPRIDETVIEVAERIADLSNEYHIPLELNCGSGVRKEPRQYEDMKRYAYPTRAFFEVFAKKKCEIVIGLDVHDPNLFLTDERLNRALSVIEGLDLNIIYDYDLIEAAKKRKKSLGYIID